MKFTLNILEKRSDEEDRRWPRYVFGGRLRASTLVLIVAFLAAWWVYDVYRPQPQPAPQVVPPGFVPDPNYTWVPKSRVQQPPGTVTPTPTPTPTTTPTPTSTEPPSPPPTSTPPPPFVLPTLPCVLPPQFCPPSSSVTPTPSPGPVPAPTSAPPAG